MYVNVAVLTETQPYERRVALVPSVVPKLRKLGARLHMQSGAGAAIHLDGDAFEDVDFIAEVRGAPGRWPHAGPDGRAAGRGRRALRHDLPARRHQRRLQDHGCRAGHRRQRRREPGRSHRQGLADFRHADPRRRLGQVGLRLEARRWQGLRRHRHCTVLRRQLQHGLRRCAGRADQDDRGGSRARPARGGMTFVKADTELQPLSSIDKVFDQLAKGEVPSRVVLDFSPRSDRYIPSELQDLP